MTHTKGIKHSSFTAAAVVGAALILSGCGDDKSEASKLSPATASTNSGPTQSELAVAAQLASITNQFAAAQGAQTARIEKLLERIDLLEKRNADQAAAIKTSDDALATRLTAEKEQNEKLRLQIGGLQEKVQSLESGRVLPEIALAAANGPTSSELDQKIRIIERKGELAAEASEAKAKEQPKMNLGANGFSFSSGDTNFTLAIKGLVQLDSRTFFNDNEASKGNDSFVLRRARPIIQGTLFKDIDFQFTPDFGGNAVQIFDAFVNYRVRPELQLRAGKFKGPVGLENLQSDATLPFNERSPVSALVPSRNLGVQLWGDISGGLISYAVGAFNVAGDGRNPGTTDFGDEKEFAGRLFSQPFVHSDTSLLKGINFGVGASYSQISSNATGLPATTGGTLPGYVTAGQQQFFAYNPLVGPVLGDGAQWRVSPAATYAWGPFGLMGEYIVSHQSLFNSGTLRDGELAHKAWQVSAQWVLTGEEASFNGITPRRPFDWRAGGWGAWQLVARIGELDIDDRAFPAFANPALSASGATSWSVGLNWWLNRNLRVLTSYSRTTFDGGGAPFNLADPATQIPPSTVTFQDENVFLTRLQLAF